MPGHGKTSDPEALVLAPGYVYTTDEPEIVACKSGLHGSRSALDALNHATGSIICRTRHWGDVDEKTNKLASRHREVLWMADAERELRLFACWPARQVWHLLTDERMRRVVDVAERFARGEASADELAAARAAARAAKYAAAHDAANAAWTTAYAARAAAYDAAYDTAYDAANAARAAAYAARAAASAAAYDTEYAEYAAAYDAARDAQRIEFERRMLALGPQK